MKSAKYIKLYQWLKKQIVDGEMGPGSKVYSELKLADMFQISRQTVRQGISLLENEGLVTRVQGSGTYVTEQSGKYIRRNTKVIGVIMTYVDDYIFPSIINGIILPKPAIQSTYISPITGGATRRKYSGPLWKARWMG